MAKRAKQAKPAKRARQVKRQARGANKKRAPKAPRKKSRAPRTRTLTRSSRRARPVRKTKPVRKTPAAAKKPVRARAKASVRKPAKRRTAAGRAERPTPAALQRERRQLADEITAPIPSTLTFSPKASAAGSGAATARLHRDEHSSADRDLTAGDVDSSWEEAYSEGDEAPGGDNPTPDQDVVEEIGRALGVEYDDAEELKGADKISERDRHRWEYNPASADDYKDRGKE